MSDTQPLDDDLAQAAAELYAVPPGEFMGTRTALVARARAAKDRKLAAAIGKLRKPSNAAAVINALVRAQPQLVDELESVGAQLRAAQSNLHGTALSALRPVRDALIADLLAAARESARGLDLGFAAAMEGEIRDTVIAALASEDAEAAVTSGALTRALQYSGFGEVDLADAVVATATGRRLRVLASPAPPTEEAEPTEDAEAEVEEAAADEQIENADQSEVDVDEEPEADGESDVNEEPDGEEEPDVNADQATKAVDPADAERLIEEAAAAYQKASAAVTAAKSAVAQGSEQLDALKLRVAALHTELESAEAELEHLFAKDAQAREAVTAAVKARQAAAALLAQREAAADA